MRRKLTRTAGVNCERKQIIGVLQDDGHYKMTRIHSKKNEPIWKLFKEFFNNLNINEEFTRRQMFHACYESNVADEMKRSRTATPDAYRCYVCRLGMAKLIKPGRYRKLMNLPDVPLAVIQKASKENKGWKEWFVPLHEKLGVDESELK